MSKQKCKECSDCTKSVVGKILSAPKSIVSGTVGKVTIGLFKKKCPICGHYMSKHKIKVENK